MCKEKDDPRVEGEWKDCPNCNGVGYIPRQQDKPWDAKEVRCEICDGRGKII